MRKSGILARVAGGAMAIALAVAGVAGVASNAGEAKAGGPGIEKEPDAISIDKVIPNAEEEGLEDEEFAFVVKTHGNVNEPGGKTLVSNLLVKYSYRLTSSSWRQPTVYDGNAGNAGTVYEFDGDGVYRDEENGFEIEVGPVVAQSSIYHITLREITIRFSLRDGDGVYISTTPWARVLGAEDATQDFLWSVWEEPSDGYEATAKRLPYTSDDDGAEGSDSFGGTGTEADPWVIGRDYVNGGDGGATKRSQLEFVPTKWSRLEVTNVPDNYEKVTFEAKKVLDIDGKELLANSFYFRLYDMGMNGELDEATNDADGNISLSSWVKFDDAGQSKPLLVYEAIDYHNYDVIPDEWYSDVEFDRTKWAVAFRKNDDGTLTQLSGVATEGEDGYECDELTEGIPTFVNTLRVDKPKEKEAWGPEVDVTARKVLEGGTLEAGQFQFAICLPNEAGDAPDYDRQIVTATNDADGSVKLVTYASDWLDYVTYPNPNDDLEYEITLYAVEIDDGQEGVTYDKTAWPVRITGVNSSGNEFWYPAVDIPEITFTNRVGTPDEPTPEVPETPEENSRVWGWGSGGTDSGEDEPQYVTEIEEDKMTKDKGTMPQTGDTVASIAIAAIAVALIDIAIVKFVQASTR